MNWNEFFMNMVYLAAMKSKDESTQVGAVIVGNDHEVLSIGFNGICRGVGDSSLHNRHRHKRPEKYFWYEHAERNAIYNAARQGICTKDTVMYTNGIPCMDCARAVIQAGISILIVDVNWGEKLKDESEKWKESCDKTEGMLKEAGVTIIHFDFKKPVIINTKLNGYCVF